MKLRVMMVLMLVVFTSSLFSQVRRPIFRGHVKRGMELYQKGKIEEAKQEFLAALQMNNKNHVACDWLSQIYFQQKKYGDAVNYAEKAIKLNPRTKRAYLILGAIYHFKGEQEKAQRTVKRALEIVKSPEEKEKIRNLYTQYKEKQESSTKPIATEDIDRIEMMTDTISTTIGRKPYIAVFPFEDTNVRTEHIKIGETLTEMLTTALIQEEVFQVMERAQLQKLLNEQALGQSGAIDSETAVKVGKLVGLQAVVIGSVSQLRTVIEGDARMIEVETGKALTATNSKVNNIDNIRNLANELGNQIAAKAYLVETESDSTKEQ